MTAPSSDPDHPPTGHLVRRLVREHVSRHWWRLAIALVCMAVVAACTAASAKIMEPVIDEIFTNRNRAMLLPLALGVLGIFSVKGVCAYGQAVLMADVGRRIIAELQSRMIRTLMESDLAQLGDISSGRLVSRFTYDAQQLYSAASSTLTGIGKDTLTVVFLAGLMIYQDWQMAALALIVFPIAFIPIIRLGRRMRRVSRTTQIEFSELTNLLSQIFQGFRDVKAAGAERREIDRADKVIWRVAKLGQRQQRIKALNHPIMETLGGLAIVAVILYGGTQVIEGNRTTGSFFAFISALLLAYDPMRKLAQLNANLQQGLAAAARVFETVDMQAAIVDAPGARPVTDPAGRIAFENVHFRYAAADAGLDGVDLIVEPGQTCALVGPSGAGKTTILNLIARFYDPSAGRIDLDGVDLRDLAISGLRNHMALVSQDVFLFDDTIRANIAYAAPAAGEDALIEAAKAAAAHDFIQELPDGYDTLIGERGMKLSGGQRQRLSIARAMLKDAPILLLDEATSALDTASERLVQQALERLMAGRTSLVIAHRLSTVRRADRIFVMNGGRVVERGSHEDLLAGGGLYARLWALQTDGDPVFAAAS